MVPLGQGGRTIIPMASHAGHRLAPQVHHVDVGAQSDVIGEIPTVMIGVVIEDDVIAVPVPIAGIGDIHRCDAEVEAAEPESPGPAAGEPPNVLGPKSGSEMPMFPGMIKLEARISASRVMSNPMAVLMYVRCLWVARLIAKVPVLFYRMRIMFRLRTVCRRRVHLPSVLFTMFPMLRE